jgi:hypothetical protein
MRTTFAVTTVALLAGAQAFQGAPAQSGSRTTSSSALNAYVPSGFTPESYKKFKEDEKKKASKKNLGGVGPRGFQSRSMQSFQEAMERGEASHLMPVFNAAERIKKGELKKEDIPVSLYYIYYQHHHVDDVDDVVLMMMLMLCVYMSLFHCCIQFANLCIYVQYMQRGGAWDNSDVKGVKKNKWLSSDKEYASGGFLKEQSVSIFGKGKGLDWTGKEGRTGPSESIPGAAPKFGRNYKPPNVNNMKGAKKGKKAAAEEAPKKKLWGLF